MTAHEYNTFVELTNMWFGSWQSWYSRPRSERRDWIRCFPFLRDLV